jgi:hypothetical protein
MSRKLAKLLKRAAANPALRPSARAALDAARERMQDYRRIQPGEPMYGYIEANRRRGIRVCDSVDHNGPGYCSNPDCFKSRH